MMRVLLGLILLLPLSLQAAEVIDINAPKKSLCAKVLSKVSKVLDGVDYLAAKAAKPWKFSELEEMRFGGIFFDENLHHDHMIEKLLHSMVRARADRLPEKRRASFLAAYKEVFFPDDSRFTLYPPDDMPSYQVPGNTIMMGKRDPSKFPVILMHETDHAHTSNKYKIISYSRYILKPIEKFLLPISLHLSDVYRTANESSAFGSEWELVSRIPEEIRTKKMNEIKRELKAKGIEFWDEKRLNNHQDDVDSLLQILTYISYENAHLPKDEFIRYLQKVHHYTMSQFVGNQYLPFSRYLKQKIPAWILISLYFL